MLLILANNADPDEMQHHAAFHLGLRCLPKYLFRGTCIKYTKDTRAKMSVSRKIDDL